MLYRVHPCVLRNYRAFVDWVIDGKRNRKYFTSEAKAKVWAEARNREVKNSGMNAYALPEALRVQAQEAALLLEPFGKTILDAVKLAIPIWRETEASRAVKDVISDMLAIKRADGRSERYLQDLRLRLAQFAATFGERKIAGITTGEIRAWLAGLPVGPVSRNNSRRLLSVLWDFALQNEWCSENVIAKTKTAVAPAQKIGILAPGDAARLLFNAPRRIVPHLAIGLFCGLRRSELQRIGPESVKWDSGLIEAQVTKTRGAARRFITIRRNLRAWLLGCGPIQRLTEDQFREDIDAAIEAAGIAWPHNALRHSFCSYALAHERNLNDLTLEMGHTNPHTLFAHYRELVTPADAAEYWRLTPARAAALSC